jgi:hypothetical protein
MSIGPDTIAFMLFLLAGSAGAYFTGYAMNGVMQEDGFGVLMNATILAAGGFLGFYANKHFYLPFDSVTAATVMIVSCAFLSLAVLAVLKNLLRRLGY